MKNSGKANSSIGDFGRSDRRGNEGNDAAHRATANASRRRLRAIWKFESAFEIFPARRNRLGRCTAVLLIIAWLAPLASRAMISGSYGNQPVTDYGWPDGALTVANLASRVGYWEGPPFGGGQWQFLYRGDAVAFQQTLTNFASIRAPKLELVIHDGPEENFFLKIESPARRDARVDWTFTVWNPASWNNLYNNPKMLIAAGQREFHQPVDPPRLDVYLGGGQVDWEKVKVPANISVRDERASVAGVDLSGGSVVQAEFFDMNTGKPVKGVRLVAEKTSWQAEPNPHWNKERFAEAESDAAGRVRIERIPADTIRLTAVADGYAPRYLDQRTHVRAEFLKFTVELAKIASVRGIVTDTDGRAVKGAKVRTQMELASNGRGYSDGRHYEPADSVSAVTDDAGRFELTGLPTGYAQFFVTASGYYFNGHLATYEVPATNLVLSVGRAGAINAAVIDRSGRGLSKADGRSLMVFIDPKDAPAIGTATWGAATTVKEDGTCEFKNVPPGEYRVATHTNPGRSDPSHAPEQIITVKRDAATTVKITYE